MRWGVIVLVAVVIGLVVFEKITNLSRGTPLELKLSRGALTVLEFPSKKATTSALILFASGDGGWGRLEENLCRAFQKQGYKVLGIDSVAYARTDYDGDILQADFSTIAQAGEAPFGKNPRPLIVGGYSMGAAQAIAVAGGPHPPSGLIGLLLIDPLSRGRYGLRSSDKLNVLPTGPGTFSAGSFSDSMKSLRVVQWHAQNDSIDSRSWLETVTAQYRTFTFPGAGHAYNINRSDFVRQLTGSVGWILGAAQDGGARATAKNGR